MKSGCTVVSGFLADANTHRSLQNYLALGSKLLAVPIPKVIFLERRIVRALCHDYDRELNILCPFEMEELVLFDALKNNQLEIPRSTTTPEKDTREYLSVINNKTAWARKAAEMNPFETTQFVWIDFGIAHVFDNSDDRFVKAMQELPGKAYDKVRIAGIWEPTRPCHADLFHHPMWYFAGGVFGGDRGSLLEFDDLFQKYLKRSVDANRLTWEVNIWYQVYLERPDLFFVYVSDHSPLILEAY